MKRVFFWMSVIVCLAVGIGVSQALNSYASDPGTDESTSEADPFEALAEVDDPSVLVDVLVDQQPTKLEGPVTVADELTPELGETVPPKTNETGRGAGTRFGGRGVSRLGGGRRSGAGFGGGGPTEVTGEKVVPNQEGVWTSGVGITWSENKDKLYGFSHTTGSWAELRIDPQEEVIPTVGKNMAAVPFGSSVAGFSGTTGTWGLLTLNQPIIGGPAVGDQLVTVHTSDHIYTFGAALGEWTSPTDAWLKAKRSYAAIMDGHAIASDIRVSQFEAGILRGDHSVEQLEQAYRDAEQKTIELSQQLHRVPPGTADEALVPLKTQLRAAVTSAFDSRRTLQTARMKQMQSKLTQISDSLQAREQRRERIIERRVEELQDPRVNWQAMRKHGGSEIQMQTSAEFPTTGTSVGLPSSAMLPKTKLSETISGNQPVPTARTTQNSDPVALSTAPQPPFDWQESRTLREAIRKHH